VRPLPLEAAQVGGKGGAAVKFKLPEAARMRAREAWDQRYKHSKAANVWLASASEFPVSARLSEILAEWMTAYADADAAAERAFEAVAAELEDQDRKARP
jgi:hypothetical protein